MKRLFIILAAVVMAVSGMAQSHAQVFGKEMKGTITEFAEYMVKQQGWRILKDYSSEHAIALTKEENGEILTAELGGTPISNTIFAVTVYYALSNEATWKNVKAAYDKWTEIYGAPIEVKEHFDPPYSETNNPIYAICNGKGRLYKVHQVKGGELLVEISPSDRPDKIGKAFLYTYCWIDTQNDRLYTKEEKQGR